MATKLRTGTNTAAPPTSTHARMAGFAPTATATTTAAASRRRTDIRKFHEIRSLGCLLLIAPKSNMGFYGVLADMLRSGMQNLFQLVGKSPKQYIAGAGRGAVDFTTQSDIGSAS